MVLSDPPHPMEELFNFRRGPDPKVYDNMIPNKSITMVRPQNKAQVK